MNEIDRLRDELTQLRIKIVELEQSDRLFKETEKKLQAANKQLQASEEKFRSLYDNINVGVALHEIILDKKGKPIDFIFLDVNPTYEIITTLKKKDVIGKRGLDVIPNLEQKWIELYGKVALTGEAVSIVDHSNFLDKYWDVKAYSPGKNQFAVALTEISEKVKAENELRIREDRYRNLIETASDAIYLMSEDGTIIDTNQSALDISGKTREEIIGQTLDSVDPNYPLSEFLKFWEDVPFDKQIIFESTHRHKSGDLIPVELSAKKYKLNDQVFYYGIARDITERKLAEDLLGESDKRFQNLSEATFEAVFFSEKGICIDQNASAEKMFGYTLEEAIGRMGTEWIVPEDRELVMNNMISGYEGPYEVTALRKDGSRFPAEIKAKNSPYKDRNVRVTALTDISARKQAEKALRESEHHFRFLAENAKDMIYRMSIPGGVYEYVSPASIELFGYTSEEFYNTPLLFKKVLHPDWEEYFNNEWQNLLDGKNPPSYEYQITHKSGELKWLNQRNSLIKDENGRPIAIEGIVTDVTERKKAAAVLLAEKLFSESLIRSLPGVFYLISEERRFLRWNKKFEVVTGRSAEDMARISPMDLFEGEDKQAIAEAIQKAFTHGQVQVRARFVSKDGKRTPYQFSGARIVVDGTPNLIGLGLDITAQQQAEIALVTAKEKAEENEERFRTLYNSNPLMIFTVDADGIILSVNEAGVKQLGYSKEDLLGNSVLLLFHDDDKHKVIELKEECLLNPDKIMSWELRKITKNGKLIYVNENARVVQANDGSKIILIMCEDITERKRTEKALLHAKEKAEKNEEQLRSLYQKLRATNEQLNANEQQLKALNNSLIASEIQFRNLFNSMQEGVYLHRLVYDNQGKACNYQIIETNAISEKLLSIRREDAIGKLATELYGTKEAPFIDVYSRVAETGEPVSFEKYFEPMNKHFFISVFSPKKGDFATAFLDITERKKAEQALHQITERLQFATEGAHVGTWHWNTISGELIWSSVMNELFDIPQDEEITYERFSQALHPDDRERTDEAVNIALDNHTDFNIEYRCIWRDGSVHWRSAMGRGYYDESGKNTRMEGVVIDITDQKNAEHEMLKAKEKSEKNEEQLKLLNSLTSEMLLLQDLESIYTLIAKKLQNYNPNTIVLYVSMDESSQQTKLEVISGLENKLLKKVIKISGFNPIGKTYQLTNLHWNLFKTGNFVEFEGGLTEFSASEFPAFATNAIERLIGLHKIYTIGINKDDELLAAIHFFTFDKQVISDGSFIEVFVKQAGLVLQKKINEKALTIAKEKAEESDRLKSAFLANMSHEIRTPMNGILGFSNLLREPNLSGDQQQKYIGVIEKSGKRMLNIINDIIDISKIEAGLMTLDINESDINEQIEYIYAFFKPEVEAKGMKLLFQNTLTSKEAIIKTDREKVFAVLTNLVKNAIKYTNKGSIEFGYNKKGSFMEFFIKDTGIGIPKDRLEAVFERFIQADIDDVQAQQGAGLGLAISKAYVEMLGGNIWAVSEEGHGSTFYFTIPYHEAIIKESRHEMIDVAGDLLGLKLRLLIVEDDETSNELLSIILGKYATEIISVVDGNKAIEACRLNPDIDLILLDIQLPGMNGYEVSQQIRTFNKEVVIIAQTAYGLSGDREKAISAGCNDYISKPVSKQKLDALIQMYFKKK